jgi:hypothetical protein
MSETFIIIEPWDEHDEGVEAFPVLYVKGVRQPKGDHNHVSKGLIEPIDIGNLDAWCAKHHPGVRVLHWDQCWHCDEFIDLDTDYYMVTEPVWQAARVPEPVQLHQKCLEQRIGRLLCLADYTRCKVNERLFYGAELYQRQTAAEDHPDALDLP